MLCNKLNEVQLHDTPPLHELGEKKKVQVTCKPTVNHFKIAYTIPMYYGYILLI